MVGNREVAASAISACPAGLLGELQVARWILFQPSIPDRDIENAREDAMHAQYG
jgi:hypothetical protein